MIYTHLDATSLRFTSYPPRTMAFMVMVSRAVFITLSSSSESHSFLFDKKIITFLISPSVIPYNYGNLANRFEIKVLVYGYGGG